IKYGYVIDFLNFHFWPVFNLADTFIVSGTFLLFFLHIRSNNASSIYQNR
ncbi:signal peptidase II, partial [bacterium]|nr:signal peptidase II [bacterium]